MAVFFDYCRSNFCQSSTFSQQLSLMMMQIHRQYKCRKRVRNHDQTVRRSQPSFLHFFCSVLWRLIWKKYNFEFIKLIMLIFFLMTRFLMCMTILRYITSQIGVCLCKNFDCIHMSSLFVRKFYIQSHGS